MTQDKKKKKTDLAKSEKVLETTRMNFGDHLLELRERIIKSLIGIIVAFGVSLLFGKYILLFVAEPMLIALAASGHEPSFYFNAPPEYFLTYVKVSLICGIFLSAPWTFYQIWGFIAAGLYTHEKKFVNVFAPFSAVLFMLGGVFFVIVVAPISFNFFITFGNKWLSPDLKDSFFYKRFADEEKTAKKEIDQSNLAETPETIQDQPQGKSIFRFSVDFLLVQGKILPIPNISINVEGESNKHLPDTPQSPESPESLETPETPETPESLETPESTDESASSSMVKPWITLKHYISFVIWLTLVFGLAFQMPLVVFMLGQLGLVALDTLKSMRKYVLFGIIIASAVITPPDVISQIMLSIPMYALYEVGIILVQLWPKRK